MNHLGNILEKDLEKVQIEVHIRIKKRNGKKSFTYIEGLEKVERPENMKLEDFLQKLSKIFKKTFICGGFIEEGVIALNGDHRDKVREFLLEKKFATDEQIKMHGF